MLSGIFAQMVQDGVIDLDDEPATFAQRLEAAAVVLGGFVIIVCVGVLLHKLIGKSSPERRRHGRYVLLWMLAGFLSAGMTGVLSLEGYGPIENQVWGLAWFGLLSGWVIGMFHGGVVLAVWPERQPGPPNGLSAP